MIRKEDFKKEYKLKTHTQRQTQTHADRNRSPN